MPTAILNPIRGKWKVLSCYGGLPSHLMSWIRPSFTSRSDDNVSEFERALRTVSMAGNPGEDYEVLAERIEREAVAYKNFLKEPQRIGKIALNVKELGADDDVQGSHEQYRVNHPAHGQGDPAEGKATVSYTFNRSNNRVLEFFVHDEDGKPIFPIARTYTSWIGAKSFDLGLGRTFYLSMAERAPGYVLVKAGFSPFAEVDETIGMSEEKPRSMAAGAVGRGDPADNGNSVRGFFGFRIPEFLTESRFAVNFVLGLLWLALAAAVLVRPVSRQSTTSDFTPLTDEKIVGGAAQESRVSPDAAILAGAGDSLFASLMPTGSQLPPSRVGDAGKARRLAAIKTVRISIDNSACNANPARCYKLLAGVRQEMHHKLGGKLPILPNEQANDQRTPYELVVSYMPVDSQHGQIQISLFDQEGTLWNGEHGFTYTEDGEGSFINSYSTQVARQILSRIQYARDQVSAGVTAEQAEGSTVGQ